MKVPDAYKFVSDDRKPVLVKHSNICYPPPNENLIDSVDTSYPGIIINYENGKYLIEDGCHRIGKLQKEGIYESLFYVVTVSEYKDGIVKMCITKTNQVVSLGEWNHNTLDVIPHKH